MLNSLNFEYLSIKTIAKLTGINSRTLQRHCENGKYQTRKVNTKGGKSGLKYEILFSSLESELQHKIILNSKSSLTTQGGGFTDGYLHDAPVSLSFHNTSIQEGAIDKNCAPVSLDSNSSNALNNKPVIPQEAKKLALVKVDIISHWQNFRKDKKNKKEADENFVLAFNKGLISETLLNSINKISIRSLQRWNKTLNENKGDYNSLINAYNYTGESELNTSLTDIEKQEFIKLYYNDAQFNLATAYNILKYKFNQNGLEIKSLSTFRRFVEYIKRNHNDFNILSRNGEKALKDEVVPYIKRDTSDFEVGDVLVADGNKLDFMVIDPFKGTPVRATMVVFQDWKSKDIAGYEIMLSENTQCISSALRNSILRLGKIPKYVYMDNGKAFKGDYFTGVKNFQDCNFQGIYQNLGIKTIFAKPYNGRAKVVERFFSDFVKSCPPAIGSYIGSSISKQPARNKRNEKFHKELHKNDKTPTIQQAKFIIEEWLKYYRSRPHPHNKNEKIGDVFNSGIGKGVDIDMLDELMMSSVLRTVRKNTIQLFNQEYISENLYGRTGKFVVKYSLFDISKIKIYSQKGEYIGTASTVVPVKALAREFGDACDLYNYKMQQKRQNAYIKSTMQKTKALIGSSNPFDDIPWTQLPDDVVQLKSKRIKKNLQITCYENAHLPAKIKLNV